MCVDFLRQQASPRIAVLQRKILHTRLNFNDLVFVHGANMVTNRTAKSGSRSTPAINLTPSNRSWVSEYRTPNTIQELRQPFRGYVEAFLSALRAAGAKVSVNATYRDPKRAYLMHWSWKIAKNHVKPEDVPAMDGVPISWHIMTRMRNICASNPSQPRVIW